ncbi:hypothetical protein EGJ15_03645 [Pseudomonas sp. p99-361]|nr:hypothetical protein EGJ15_03645 [Pseudomonas sp. p99-361]
MSHAGVRPPVVFPFFQQPTPCYGFQCAIAVDRYMRVSDSISPMHIVRNFYKGRHGSLSAGSGAYPLPQPLRRPPPSLRFVS